MFLRRICILNVITVVTLVISSPLHDLHEENIVREPRSGTDETSTEGGVIKNMWHKITNFFRAEASTASTPPTEKPKQKRQGLSDRPIRIVPPETRKGNLHHDVRRMQKETAEDRMKEGGFIEAYPYVANEKLAGNIQHEVIPEEELQNDPYLPEVRATYKPRKILFASSNSRTENVKQTLPEENYFKFDDQSLRFNEGTSIVEEFDQGQDEELRKKRFQDIPINEWQTEKISEGSDPVENIDGENFKEEIGKDPFLFHEPQLQTIEVEENDDANQYEIK